MKRSTVCVFILPLLFALPGCGEGAAGNDDGIFDAGTDATGTDTGETGDGDGDGDGDSTLVPIPVLGNGSHDLDSLEVTIISSPSDGLNFPTDLEFNPDAPNELWVTNREDFSMVIYQFPGLPNQSVSKAQAAFSGGDHFMAKPAALAFGASGRLATAQQEQTVTQPGDPADGSFMGPTMWTSNSANFTGGHESHYDMLHNSPLSSGIAWDTENSYWVFDGAHGSLTYYRFNSDHGAGGTDHSDGQIYRYADGQLGYENSIPSHVARDADTAYVYAADSANNRIVRLDPTTATMGGVLGPNYDGGQMAYMNDAELLTLVDGNTLEVGMSVPSGLELVDGILFVTDPIQTRVYAFNLDGELLDWLDTDYPAGSLMGMAFDDGGDMWITDASGNQIRRFSAP